jgi:cysteine desulfurase
MIYLDHNATTPIRPEVRAAMLPCLQGLFGNPSSLHTPGRRARQAVDSGRAAVAALLHMPPESIHFTSGGTEADNWALRCRRRVVTSAVEHAAVIAAAEALRDAGNEVVTVAVDGEGRIDPEAVLVAVDAGHTDLVSLILANNETGTLQPLAEIGPQLRARGVLFHIDAVQAVGKIPVDLEALGADLLSMSAHKINGPKGIGALYVRPGTELKPWSLGGGHEYGLRAGTENVAGIVGFGAAADLRRNEMATDATIVGELRDRLQRGITEAIADVVVHGSQVERLPGTLNVSFRGVEAESILLGLDLEGIAVSSGSACTAGAPEPSHVLLAMGCEPRLAAGAVRFSLGYGNDVAEMDRVVEILVPVVERLRALSMY